MSTYNQNQNQAPKGNPKSGYSLIGIYKGCRLHEEGKYKNYFCGIVAGDNVDDYGVLTENLVELTLNEQQYLMLIKDQSLIGQPVRAWINPRLVSGVSAKGKPYAFIVTNLLRDTYIESLNTAEPIKKVG